MAALCKFCAKLNTTGRCAFCGNSLIAIKPLRYKAELSSETELTKAGDALIDYVVAPPTPAKEKKPRNGMAIAGFVLSILCYTMIFGLIFSIIGLKKSKRMDGNGKRLATAGIVISTIILVGLIIMYLIVLVIIPLAKGY